MRRAGIVVFAALIAASALTSVGVAPPVSAGDPPPRVLIVGDSMGKQLHTTLLLGYPDYVALDRTAGACTLSRGTILGYNRDLFGGPGTSCNNWPTDFAQWAQSDNPDVIVLVIGGWDRPDRWGNTLPAPCSPGPWCPPPKYRITQPKGDARFLQAITRAIDVLRTNSGVPVIVATEPYSKPKTPTQGILKNVYWEPYELTPPGPTAAWPKGWRAPMKDGSTPYISGRTKIDRINQLIHQAKDTTFAADDDVIVVDMNPMISTTGGFMARICPYPGELDDCPMDQRVRSRLSDNTHLSDEAQKYVLDELLSVVDAVT